MKKYRVKGTGEIAMVIPATLENAGKIIEWLNCDLCASAKIKNKYPSKSKFIFYQKNGVDIQVLLDRGYYFHFSKNGNTQVFAEEKLDHYEEIEEAPDKSPNDQPIIFRKEGDVFGVCIPSLDITSFGDSWEEAKEGAIAALEYILDGSLRNYQEGGKSDEGMGDFLQIYKDFIEAIEKKYKEPTPSKIKADIEVSPEALNEIEKKIEEIGGILDGSVKAEGRFEPISQETAEGLSNVSESIQDKSKTIYGSMKGFSPKERFEDSYLTIKLKNGFCNGINGRITKLSETGKGILTAEMEEALSKWRKKIIPDTYVSKNINRTSPIFGSNSLYYLDKLLPLKKKKGSERDFEIDWSNITVREPLDMRSIVGCTPQKTQRQPHEKLGITEKEYDTLFKVLTKVADEEIAKTKAARRRSEISPEKLIEDYLAGAEQLDRVVFLDKIKRYVDGALEDCYQ